MYKVVWFGRFLDGIDREEAHRHWREIHGPLGRAVPQIETYVQSHAVEPLGRLGITETQLGFDGYSCCWYADEEACRESFQTPEWAKLGPDGDDFFDMPWFTGMSAVLDERTIIDGPYGPFKTVWAVRFTDEIRSDPARSREAHEHWLETHGGFGREVPGIGRYVQNHCVAPLGAEGADESIELLFDGFSECWFDDRAAFERAMGSDEWLEMNADADTFCDVDWIVGGMSAIVDEYVVKGSRPEVSSGRALR
jgi:uncharacterized protein (TIGR02118 family)